MNFLFFFYPSLKGLGLREPTFISGKRKLIRWKEEFHKEGRVAYSWIDSALGNRVTIGVGKKRSPMLAKVMKLESQFIILVAISSLIRDLVQCRICPWG